MIYTELTKEAMNIAYKSHHKQKDKGGFPYINHPLHIAEEMDDEYSTCVALLHDVVEDSDITLNDLSKIFPPEVIKAIDLLTRKDNILYADYIKQIKTNEIATKVKLADLAHNMDKTRCIDKPIKMELIEKYLMAYTILRGDFNGFK